MGPPSSRNIVMLLLTGVVTKNRDWEEMSRTDTAAIQGMSGLFNFVANRNDLLRSSRSTKNLKQSHYFSVFFRCKQ